MSGRLVRLMVLVTLASCAPAPRPIPAIGEIAVVARPIPLSNDDPAQVRVGALRFMGGLHLQSDDRRFGGLSGLRWFGGRLYAVSDAGDWLALDLREEGGRLTGIGRVRVQRLTGLDGGPLQGKKAGDAEAINLDFSECGAEACEPASAIVAFEQDHRIWAYDLEHGLPAGLPRPLAVPAHWRARLPGNGGMEAVAGVEGLWLIVSESLRTASGAAGALVRHGGVAGGAPSAMAWEQAEVPVADGFSPTDADYLDGRDFLTLFRRYSLMHGVAARVERVSVGRGARGETRIVTRPVAELAPPLNVDNMEGLAVRHEDDRVFIYLLSDDNFSGLQRTLLMKFEYLPK